MSAGEDDLGALLASEYPHLRIIPQRYVHYKKAKLFFDFTIPALRLAFEYDGRQHSQYVPFMHGNRSRFEDAKRRDSLKEQWAEENQYALIRIGYREEVTAETLRRKILEQTQS